MSVQSLIEALSFPYHQPRHGFWGEKTSTLNFCEEDYVMSYYCAEVCNARYYKTKDPQFHQDAYAVLTATVVFSNMWIMERTLRPALKAREESRKREARAPRLPTANETIREMWVMVATGLSVFLGGYLIWNLDNMYCNTIRKWRHQLQLPWAVVLEGHAWWHLMTGIGAYFYIVWRIWVHRCLDGDEDKFRLVWPSIFRMPEVLLREVETQAIAAQQQISLVRTQQASKQRELRMAQLTRSEISSLPAGTNVYEGVGKMFVAMPVAEMKGKLDSQIKEVESEVDGLGKRLHYLEVSQKNSKDQIDRMLRGGVGAS
ncbi:hypothetical protein Daesc_000911 [Daldinia eschscholtzii]|uniref:Uncharacterized protein n=1 Tax=Daldinia eschscholtzii TaxID=292717 RepID=A0AAX6MZP6_9PEZI